MERSIIYCENGQEFHFFHSDSDGLCMDNGDGVQVLLKDARFDFDVCLLGSVIYLVCQSFNGELILLRYFDSKWHKQTLLVSKAKEAYNKNFYLLITGGCLQLFYTIKSSGRLLLIQQILCEEGTEPVVVAPVHEGVRPFFVVADSELNTYIYYQSEQGGFGYKMYKWSSKALGDFVPVINDICSSVYAIIDMYGRHHICCICQNFIVYMQRGLDGEYAKQSRIPCHSVKGDAPAYIHLEDEKIYIIWQQQRAVMYALSTDDAQSFCSPVRIISSGEAPALFSLQHKRKRTLSLGCFSGGKARFISIGAHSAVASVPRMGTQSENKRFIKRDAPAKGSSADIERIKSAISAIGKEVSELKGRLELVMSLLEKNNADK